MPCFFSSKSNQGRSSSEREKLDGLSIKFLIPFRLKTKHTATIVEQYVIVCFHPNIKNKPLQQKWKHHAGTKAHRLFFLANCSVKTAGLVAHQHIPLPPPPPILSSQAGMLRGQVWAHCLRTCTQRDRDFNNVIQWSWIGVSRGPVLSCASGWQTSSRVFVLSRGAPDHSAQRRRWRRRRLVGFMGVFSSGSHRSL